MRLMGLPPNSASKLTCAHSLEFFQQIPAVTSDYASVNRDEGTILLLDNFCSVAKINFRLSEAVSILSLLFHLPYS